MGKKQTSLVCRKTDQWNILMNNILYSLFGKNTTEAHRKDVCKLFSVCQLSLCSSFYGNDVLMFHSFETFVIVYLHALPTIITD